MFRPSTAPRWKRQTRIGREDGMMEGRNDRNAARARNSGSSPRLTSARPPFRTNTRLEMVIRSVLPSFRHSVVLLFLKLRPADRQADSERASLRWIVDIRELLEDDTSRMSGHRAAKDALVDHVDEL